MYQVIWELKVKFRERDKFEQFYDPKGKWVKFFSKSPEYLGTDVLENGDGDGTFLVIDEWESEEAFSEFTRVRKADFETLEGKAKSASRTKKRIWISLNPEE
jgi:heme-degrading monooxygenase HmoA